MIRSAFSAGPAALRSRPGLALLVYAAHLVLAVILAVPIGYQLGDAIAQTGFDAELAQGFDVVLFIDILGRAPNLLGVSLRLLLWLLPVLLVWKAVMGVGLVHAVQDPGTRSFWSGVGRYGRQAVLLSLVFLAPVLVIGVAAAILAILLTVAFPGEIGAFWSWGVVLPTSVLSAFAVLDLMHDYARIALVVHDRPVMEAFFEGLRMPFRHGVTSRLYLLWFAPAAILLLLPTAVEMAVGASLLVFVVQQALMLARAGVTVAWFGSETSLYQAIHQPEAVDPVPPGPELDGFPQPAVT